MAVRSLARVQLYMDRCANMTVYMIQMFPQPLLYKKIVGNVVTEEG